MVKENLGGVRVAELLSHGLNTATPGMSVEEFVMEHALRRGKRALPVVNNGRLIGIVSITDAKELPRDAWATTAVSSIMPRAPLKTVSTSSDLNSALGILVDGTLHQLPVVEGEQLRGLLDRADILRFLQLREELDIQPSHHRMPSRAAA